MVVSTTCPFFSGVNIEALGKWARITGGITEEELLQTHSCLFSFHHVPESKFTLIIFGGEGCYGLPHTCILDHIESMGSMDHILLVTITR